MPLDIPDCPDDETKKPKVTKINHTKVEGNSDLNRYVDDSFITILNLPKCINKDLSINSLQLSIKSFNIPPIIIPTHSSRYVGMTRSESSKSISEFDDITIQFKLDNKLQNYNTLYKWLSMLIDPKNGKSTRYEKADYETSYSVLLIDEYEKPKGIYTFFGVIPVGLGSLSLDYSTSESVFLDFTFSFDFLDFELIES